MVTPQEVLDYWLGDTPQRPEALKEKNALWFQKSFETDKEIADRFVPVLGALAAGLAADWARQGPKARLAAIIVLDQFSRNVFRGHRYSFLQDPLARRLMQDGLKAGEDRGLSEPERVFFYLPAEHSEAMADQDLSVDLFETLARQARPDHDHIVLAHHILPVVSPTDTVIRAAARRVGRRTGVATPWHGGVRPCTRR